MWGGRDLLPSPVDRLQGEELAGFGEGLAAVERRLGEGAKPARVEQQRQRHPAAGPGPRRTVLEAEGSSSSSSHDGEVLRAGPLRATSTTSRRCGRRAKDREKVKLFFLVGLRNTMSPTTALGVERAGEANQREGGEAGVVRRDRERRWRKQAQRRNI